MPPRTNAVVSLRPAARDFRAATPSTEMIPKQMRSRRVGLMAEPLCRIGLLTGPLLLLQWE
jgi:hypothetical protein